MLKSATICYDANVLLNIYRYSDDTQKGLEDVFKTFVERTRLPYQVAFEYARNRAKTIIDQVNLCYRTEEAFNGVIKQFIEPRNTQPFLSDGSMAALRGVIAELTSKRKSLEAMISEDRYADLFFKLFDGKIELAPSEERIKEIYE